MTNVTFLMLSVLAVASGGADIQEDAAFDAGDCTVKPSTGHQIRLWVGCNDEEDCGIVGKPVCWSVRFACFYAGGVQPPLVDHYECQDANRSDGSGGTMMTRSPMGSGFESVERSCENYGVIVNVLSVRCKGESDCENHGIMVNVLSEYCDHAPIEACIDSVCATDYTGRPPAFVPPSGTGG